MALTSPGVEVTVIDQSQYLPAATSSVPLVIFATAQDKVNPNATGSTGIAVGTTAANAGKLIEVTSQRDLVTIYGTPKFYTTADGTPIQGYELNEYGLLAAYSALNVSNRCYCLRADIDLASLVASTGRPTGDPEDGAWWLDTTSSEWGIYEWDATTQVFEKQIPIVITDSDNLYPSGLPLSSIGNIGDYAIVAIPDYSAPSYGNATYWHKLASNIWVPLGSLNWLEYTPAVVGTQSDPTLTVGNTFTITVQGSSAVETSTATITVPGLGSNNVTGVAGAINALNWQSITASVSSSDRLELFITQDVPNVGVTISAGTGTVLTDLGISAGTYYEPDVFYGTAAQMPLWGTGQTYPRPSGSVWVKVGSAGDGLLPIMKQFDAVTGGWTTSNVPAYTNEAEAINDLNATGGLAIPAGTVYAQYDFNGQNVTAPVYFWERVATGPTVVTGTETSASFTSGPYAVEVYVTTPNSSGWSGPYAMALADNTDATDFVTAWQAAGIPYTTATVTTDGAIQITHTLGGAIRVNDIISATGLSSDLMADAGFVSGTTDGCKTGYNVETTFAGVSPTTSGAGTGCQLTIINTPLVYHINAINAAGTGYAVGDSLTIAGVNLGGVTGTNDCVMRVTSVSGAGGVLRVQLSSNAQFPAAAFEVMLSNFVEFVYTANDGAPTEIPTSGTNWFYSVTDQCDIMVNTASGWKGYRNVNFNSNGFPLPSGTNTTDPDGPIVSASEPTAQSDGTPLAYGDLWIDTSDLENYPLISRWQQVDGEDMWVLIDTSDQTSGTGLVFADARWSTNQNTINPANDPIPTIKSLLTSNNLDLDAPNSSNYPVGILLWNTRRSGNNVKQWRNNYFTPTNFPDETYPTITSTWVSASGLKLNGQAYMGRQAQRNMVVEALKSVIDTNTAIRDEDNNFNLIACPAYTEVQQNMVVLNIARGETGYILGDTPMRLPDQATQLQAWANSQAAEGGPYRNTYLGLFYPSGLASDLEGNEVVVPPSHMMLFTFLRNDQVAYPWFAAAGTRRGIISNATGIGYINPTSGEFQPIKTSIGVRDVLYTNFINPLVFFTGNGLLNYGNKTSFNSQSALDRTNVARLVAYIRRQLTIAARPFVFEPNDALTRQQISGVVETLMVDLVAKRGIYDYVVVCDESNNTPARIDRNELWIDVAVEPVKAAEFIYIPVRILNTGELSGA